MVYRLHARLDHIHLVARALALHVPQVFTVYLEAQRQKLVQIPKLLLFPQRLKVNVALVPLEATA